MLICYPICYTQSTFNFNCPFIQIYFILLAYDKGKSNQLKEAYDEKNIWHDCHQTLIQRLLFNIWKWYTRIYIALAICELFNSIIRFKHWYPNNRILDTDSIECNSSNTMFHITCQTLSVSCASHESPGKLTARREGATSLTRWTVWFWVCNPHFA